MKSPIIPILVIVLVLGAAYYYLIHLPKQRQKAETKTATSAEAPEGSPTIAELKSMGYDADEIATIVATESYKNGTGRY